MNKIVFFALFLISNTYCLHFYLKEGKEKCFSDDIPTQTVFITTKTTFFL